MGSTSGFRDRASGIGNDIRTKSTTGLERYHGNPAIGNRQHQHQHQHYTSGHTEEGAGWGPGITESPHNTQRYYMYQALRRSDPDGVWRGFNGILDNGEWHKVSEYDVIRVMQLLNKKYYFERDPTTLTQIRAVIEECEKRGLKFSTTWAFNEQIRMHLAQGRRDLAYWIKRNLDSGAYGRKAKTNLHTYAALFSDPFSSSLADLSRLTGLYDEMLNRNIAPSIQIQKHLIRTARRVGEFRLMTALLESTTVDAIPYTQGVKAARFVASRGQAYIAVRKLNSVLAELHKLLSYQIPKDTREMRQDESDAYRDDAEIRMELSDTRQAFFIYLRSLYEPLIRMYLIRRKSAFARELLDDMRRSCYLPPTRRAYSWFINFYAKRKNIDQLWEIHDLMLQDGVPFNEHIYTKLITACMFTPKQRLLNELGKRVIAQHSSHHDKEPAVGRSQASKGRRGSEGSMATTERDLVDLDMEEDAKYSDVHLNSGLPKIPRDVKAVADMNVLVFRPTDCIKLFEEMLGDYNVNPRDIRNRNYSPNVHITNSVMRAYLMLEKPALAYREFSRYCYHQRLLYPSKTPPDADAHRRTTTHVFRMALNAATLLGDKKAYGKIYTNMLEWGLPPPPAHAQG
ncbi:hypothetical protein GQ54DRAFT_296085 [Martensiomyces pterosporus]|nr:hypothetical protein GQ54DRAFT_296085 [Martensiomyces pterosporus]